nr:type II secretion system minor pseudopilin GspJ [Grimontia hollisae]
MKVGYRIQDETLERIRWMYPDNSSALEPAAMPLMEGVTGLRFEVLGDDGWKTEWEAPLSMPRAIRVTLDTERYGELTRIYLLPGQTLPPSVGETS